MRRLLFLLALGCSSAPPPEPPGGVVGAERCASCHPEAYASWRRSAHFRNLAEPTPESVLGKLDVDYTFGGTRTRVFLRDGRYFMTYRDADGREETWSIDLVLGAIRHQAYLHREPDGRLQVLPTYWNVEEQSWRDATEGPVSGEGPLARNHPEHWRNFGRTFNRQCLECHSSRGEKRYDAATNTYASTFENTIDCEACHGPGAAHVRAWERPDRAAAEGTLAPVDRYGLDAAIEACATCHARKRVYAEGYVSGRTDFYDHFAPDVWEVGAFHADGRSSNLNYRYVDYMQNGCFRRATRQMDCGFCHPPHGLESTAGRTVTEANALCTTCHLGHKTQLTEHTRHGAESDGSRCIECHMPKQDLNLRMTARDHAIGSPLPELTRRFGAPNACGNCHADQPVEWAEEAVQRWFGGRPHFEAYRARMVERASALAAIFAGEPAPTATLARWLDDGAGSVVQRASAAFFLGDAENGPDAMAALLKHRHDPHPLVRYYVVGGLGSFDAPAAVEALREATADPARVVRVRAYETLVLRRPEVSRDPALAKVRAEVAHRMDVVRADDPRALAQEAAALFLRDEPAAAERLLRRGAAIGGPVEAPRVELVQFLIGQNRPDEAEREVAQLDPAGDGARLSRALLLLARGRPVEARAMLDALAAEGRGGPAVEQFRRMLGGP